MKKLIRVKRVTAWLIVICLLFTMMPATATAQETGCTVTTVEELEAALARGAPQICVGADFAIDRTLYVAKSTRIYSDAVHTLTRATGFGGDLFVIGEDANGTNVLLNGQPVELELGGKLTLDGNKDAVSVTVDGTVLFICNSSVVNLCDDVAIINAKKVANARTYDERYCLTTPGRIGGAAAIIASGTLNIYGGTLLNNEANPEDNSGDENLIAADSSRGGAIYNNGNLNMYGGVLSDNEAGRGGAIYNYRTVHLLGGELRSNHAFAYGGAIYQAGSQYAGLIIGRVGDAAGDEILFQDNVADTSGGAVYYHTNSNLLAYGRATFDGNQALTGTGGAINSYSTLNISNLTFTGNRASSRGGAIYLSNADDSLTNRYHYLTDCIFTENTASEGGAVALYASSDDHEGAIAQIAGCTFEDNAASGSSSSKDYVAGALFAGRSSKVHVSDTTFVGNTALTEAGAVEITGGSEAVLERVTFDSNISSGHGGALTVRSSAVDIADSTFASNTADSNGGAVYISYIGASAVNSAVTVSGSEFADNAAAKYGGAVYATEHDVTADGEELCVYETELASNSAAKGGALYLTSGADAYFEDVVLDGNTTTGTSDSSNGGAIYITDSEFEMNGGSFTQNSAGYNGGALGVYSEGTAVLHEIAASGNVADNAGGFAYNSGSSLTVYDSTISENTANNGGAASMVSGGTTNIYATVFDANVAENNGGALYVYSDGSKTTVQDSDFDGNSADNYGGAIYVSKASLLDLYQITATGNTAGSGGMMYETTSNTKVTLDGCTVSQNTADSGPIIFGNTTGAKLFISKNNYTDLDATGDLDADYWKAAIANKLTVSEISSAIPSYDAYTEREKTGEEPQQNKPVVPVQEVLNLNLASSNAEIDSTYAALPQLDNNSNFMSRGTTRFDDINGGTVTVDSFILQPGDTANNPSFGAGLLLYQALLYKQAHPDEAVSVDISSFRFSVEAAVCVNRDSRYFGYMRNLAGQEYDEFGFVRISYLLVCAAKMGIDVTVIGQMDGYPVTSGEPGLEEYFTEHLSDPCDPAYAQGVVGDYMDFQFCYWTSYDDNDATDMMHTKLCAVSHYLDYNGVPHRNAVWTSSTNLDGIRNTGRNGNNKLQTGTIVSDHEGIYRAAANYLDLIAQYCEQEEVYPFRDLVNTRTTEQVAMILNGQEDQIPVQEQIVYLGGENDPVFELYFAPFGGENVVWDEVYNPYCKYLRALYDSEDYIYLIWNNANYNRYNLGIQMEEMIAAAFHRNKNANNRVYLNLDNYDGSVYDDLEVGRDIGYCSLNQKDYGNIHSKDMLLSYQQDGQRYYVSLLNSLNIHSGSMYYQSNFLLVVKETVCDGDSVFYTQAKYTTDGMAEQAVLAEVTDTAEVFDDVTNAWYSNAVDYCYTYGLLKGVGDTTFSPSSTVTRGMFITVLARMAGVDTTSAANRAAEVVFTDVPAGKYYSAAVQWAYENQVVNGMTPTEFAPNAPIQRQQICVMLRNFAKQQGINFSYDSAPMTFTDQAAIGRYARSAVSACQRAGVVNGYNDGSFRPTSYATRAEAAQLLYNFILS